MDTEEKINYIMEIMMDPQDDRVECEDYQSPSGQIAHREVLCPDGYRFLNYHVVPDGEQIDYEQSERVLDRHTEKSLRFLVTRGKGGFEELF